MSKLLLNERTLCLQPTLGCVLGDRGALMLQQIHYWGLRAEHVYEGETWFYASDADWHAQIPCWCVRTIQRVITRLVERGVVKRRPYRPGCSKQTRWWYRVDYAALADLLAGNERSRHVVTHHDKLSDPSSSKRSAERETPQDDFSTREEEDPPPLPAPMHPMQTVGPCAEAVTPDPMEAAPQTTPASDELPAAPPLAKPSPACHYPSALGAALASPPAPLSTARGAGETPPGSAVNTRAPTVRPRGSLRRVTTGNPSALACEQETTYARPARVQQPPPLHGQRAVAAPATGTPARQSTSRFALEAEIPQCQAEDRRWAAICGAPIAAREGLFREAEGRRWAAARRPYVEPLKSVVLRIVDERGGAGYVASLYNTPGAAPGPQSGGTAALHPGAGGGSRAALGGAGLAAGHDGPSALV